MKSKNNRNLLQRGLTRVAPNRLKALLLCSVALPGLLSAQTLQHEWSFNENGGTTAVDSVAGANITLFGSTSLGGGVLTLPGGGGNYAQFPNGILSTNQSITIETWLTDNQGQTWARAWSFGGSTTGPNNNFIHNNYIDLIPHSGPGPFWTEFNHNGNVDAESPAQLPTGVEEYTVVTYDAPSQTVRLYLNGDQVAIATGVTITPASLGFTYNNFLGLDQWNDAVFNGTFDEMRIWSGAVPERYIGASAFAGPGVVVNNLTPTAVTVTAGSSLPLTGAEQASATALLAASGANEVAATSDVTNWISSNPNVLKVNNTGWITAVGIGSATISGTVGGISATSAPVTVVPFGLAHRYSFISDASDSVGGADGTIVPPTTGSPATINNGLVLPGNQGGGNGVSGYVALPAGILTNTTSLTVEAWVTQNTPYGWATVWDFGTGPGNNFEMCPNPQRGINNLDVAVNPPEGEIDAVTPTLFPSGSAQYVSYTFNASSLTGSIYTNGLLSATATYPDVTYIPGSIGGAGGTTENWLGNDVYGDAQFSGSVYEFRIWNGVVSPTYIAVSSVVGPGTVITNVIPQSLNVSVTTSMIGSQTQQASVTGNLIQVSGISLTRAVTNWTSSAPSVLTVDTSGLITAVNGGTATVSATVSGVTATSATITVAATAPSIVQGPANQTIALASAASFNVSALGGSLSYQWSRNGTSIQNATNATLTLTNISYASAGTYSVKVSNTQGNISASATLTVVQAALLHRYSFVSDASDSVGGANGTIVPPTTGSPATIANGLNLPGDSNGHHVAGYVALPAGILTNTASVTLECWVTQNQANGWATAWDFGNDGQHNFEFCPTPASGRNSGNTIVAFDPNNNERDVNAPTPFPTGVEEYVCVTFNAATLVADLYTNGVLEASSVLPDSTYIPGTIGGANGTVDNWLGDNVYGDPQFSGIINEFRIWSGAVSPLYIALSSVAGPGLVETNLSPISIAVTANTSILVGETEPATATGTFQVASGVPLTGIVTNWSTSDPSVLTVDSSGVISAVGTGHATVSATFGGITGVSATITVPSSAPVITQEPTGSLNLLAGATLDANISVVGNPPFVYRWFFNGGAQPIFIATNSSTLSLSGLVSADSGTYTVLVSNAVGTIAGSPISVTITAPTPYDQVLLQLNPLGYWPLDETSGTIAYDLIGGNNGTYTNLNTGIGISQGVAGPTNAFFGVNSLAASFDGVGGVVDIPEGPFNLTGAISVVSWVQLEFQPTFDGLIGHGDASWRLSINPSGEPGAADGSALDATSANSIYDGNWHLVVYTYTGVLGANTNGTLYVDGVEVATDTVTTAPAGDNLDVWIAGAPDYGTGPTPSRFLGANIAHAAVFNYALTGAQVNGLYNGLYVVAPTIGITRSGKNVVLTWIGGTLVQSSSVKGPWTPVGGATSPYTVPATGGAEFYRLQTSP